MPLDVSLNTIAYYNEEDTDKFYNFYDKYKNGLLLLLGLVIIVFVLVFSLFNNASMDSPESRPWISAIEIILWIVLFVVIIINLKWIYSKQRDFNADLHNLFNDKRAELEVHVNKLKDDIKKKDHDEDKPEGSEVFHIPGNVYDYNNEVSDDYELIEMN